MVSLIHGFKLDVRKLYRNRLQVIYEDVHLISNTIKQNYEIYNQIREQLQKKEDADVIRKLDHDYDYYIPYCEQMLKKLGAAKHRSVIRMCEAEELQKMWSDMRGDIFFFTIHIRHMNEDSKVLIEQQKLAKNKEKNKSNAKSGMDNTIQGQYKREKKMQVKERGECQKKEDKDDPKDTLVSPLVSS